MRIGKRDMWASEIVRNVACKIGVTQYVKRSAYTCALPGLLRSWCYEHDRHRASRTAGA